MKYISIAYSKKKRKNHKKDVINSFFFNYNSRITEGGRGGGVGGLKNFFSALRASVWSKNKGGPPGPSPESATVSASPEKTTFLCK